MPFLIVVALVSFLSCAVAGQNAHAVRALTAVGHGAIAMAAIVLPRTRAACFGSLKRFERATWPYAALLLMAAVMSGAFGVGASREPYAAERAMVSLAGLGFVFVAMAGIATAVGRNRAIASLHWPPLAIALLTIIDRLDGKGDFFGLSPATGGGAIAASFATPAQSAAVFGLFAVLGAFAIVDQITRRPARVSAAEPALARRLFLPVASLVASLNLVVMSGEATGMAAAAAGLSLFLLIAWRRHRLSRNSRKEAAYAAMASTALFSAIALFSKPATAPHDAIALQMWKDAPLFGQGMGFGPAASASDGARWLAEAGIAGAALIAAAIGLIVWILWRGDDHGRRPSRGFALAAGLVLCSILNGVHVAALSAPAMSGLLAGLLGVAAAYIDPPVEALKVKQTARTRVL